METLQHHGPGSAVSLYLREAFFDATRNVYIGMVAIGLLTLLILLLTPAKFTDAEEKKVNTVPADAPVKAKESLGVFLTTTRCGQGRWTPGTPGHAIVSTTGAAHERSICWKGNMSYPYNAIRIVRACR